MAESPAPPDTGKRRRKGGKEALVLPPMGTAEQILGLREEGARTGGGPDPRFNGPEKIFAFADSVQRDQEGKRERQTEQRLETWVTFSLGDEVYGLPVTHVQEILRVAGITRVPHAPAPGRGVTNMRGKVLPVVDLRKRLDMEEAAITPLSRILVVSSRGRLLGLLVDAVQQVVRLPDSEIEPPPPDIMTARSDYIRGVYKTQNGLVIMLDVGKILLFPSAG